MFLDHIGIAVKDISLAEKEYRLLGFYSYGNLYEDDMRNIKIQFMKNDQGNNIELIQILDSEKNSPIKSFINKSNHSIYHTCYRVHNINDHIEYMCKNGYTLIAKSQEAIAFQNKKVCFLYNKVLGIIELVED